MLIPHNQPCLKYPSLESPSQPTERKISYLYVGGKKHLSVCRDWGKKNEGRTIPYINFQSCFQHHLALLPCLTGTKCLWYLSHRFHLLLGVLLHPLSICRPLKKNKNPNLLPPIYFTSSKILLPSMICGSLHSHSLCLCERMSFIIFYYEWIHSPY